MSKKVKWSLIAALIFALVVLAVYYVTRVRTKSFSPEDTVTYVQGDLELEVFYNRPYKKDREIFGGLVPYGEVWRTGANEATTFTVNQDLLVDGSLLKAGIYTLWTIPGPESWKVIFNSKMYPWGITTKGDPSREPEYDVLTLEVKVNTVYNITEQFTIYFERVSDLILMILAWDRTAVTVPIKPVHNTTEVRARGK